MFGDDFNIDSKQKQFIENYRKTHPECANFSDAEIITVMNERLDDVTVNENEKISAFWNDENNFFNPNGIKQTKTKTIVLRSGKKIVTQNGISKYFAPDGKELNQKDFEQQEGVVDIKPSGRYTVTKNGETKYFALDGTELKERYFKQVENSDLTVKTSDGKTYNLNRVIKDRIHKITIALQKVEENNGFIGKAWSGFKNFTGIGDSSDKIKELQKRELELLNLLNANLERKAEIFKELTGEEYTEDNLVKFINGEIKLKSEIALNDYIEGQDMACDIAGDIISGIGALGVYSMIVAFVPVTGGLSIAAAGLIGGIAAIEGGGLIKMGIKYADAKSGGREYDSKKRDFITGAFSGLLAPFTGGFGGAIGKTLAIKLGIDVFKQGAKQGVNIGLRSLASGSRIFNGGIKETLKNAVLNPAGYSYGGTLGKQLLAYGAEMAADGMLGGSIDTAFRTAYDGGDINEVLFAGLEGGIGGFFFAPIIGGGMKGAGKAGHYLGKTLGESDLSNSGVKELLRFGPNKKGLTGSVNKQQLFNALKNGSLKQAKYSFKSFKQFSKKAYAKSGEPRFNPNEYKKLLSKIDNPFLKKHPELAASLLKEISEMKDTTAGAFKSLGEFYHFKDEEIVEILKIVNEKNIDIFKLMLKNNVYKTCTYDGDSFGKMLMLYSDYGKEVSSKVIKMLENHNYVANQTDNVSKFLSLVEQYPEEMNILTCNFHPKQADKIFNSGWSETGELVKRMHTCTEKEKELIEILISPKNTGGFINVRMILQILDADTGLNNKQIISLFKNNNAVIDEKQLEKALNNFTKIKGKILDFSNETFYKKNQPLTKNDIIKQLREMGLSEDECKAFSDLDFAESILTIIELDELSENMLFGGMPKVQLIKYFLQAVETFANNEMIEQLSMMKKISGYINKENFELFKMHNKNGEFEDFMHDLNMKIVNIECRDICLIINKLTGKTVYEQDLHVIGTDMLKLISYKEEDIAIALKKLDELGLINEGSNIVTLITKADVLKDLIITPEIKAFAKELSGNKYVEEGSVVDILKAVQSNSTTVTNTKIRYAKELIKNFNISQSEVPVILKNLSDNSVELLNKQIKLLQKIDDEEVMSTFAKFIKSDNTEELSTYESLLEILKNNSDSSKLNTLHAIINVDNNKSKAEISNFVLSLLKKDFKAEDVSSLLYSLQKCSKDTRTEFMSLYLKGFDANMGKIKEFYEDIVLLQVSDIKHLNIKERLALYDKLSSVDENGKAVLEQLGLNYKKLLDKVIDSIGTKQPVVSINPAQSQLFMKRIIANNNPKAEKILQTFDFAQFGKEGLPLKYPRDKFNSNIEAILKDIPQEEVDIILKHFGLVSGAAGFDGLPNTAAFTNTEISKEGKIAAQKVQKEIENFLLHNEVLIAEGETKELLDGLIKGFPEFTSIAGKRQHGRHNYSVDIHTLKVLQSAMNDPLYKTLSDQDKTILKYSILLHDLGKKGGVTDEGHAGLSADYAWSILDRYSFAPAVKDRIIDIVDNHHWFEKYNTGAASAESIAVRCRRPEDLKIYEIFAKADLENVSNDFHFERTGTKTTEEFNLFMKNKYKAIEDAVNKIYENANFIFDSQFMHRGGLFPTEEILLDGNKETFRVLDFSKLAEGESLEKYGFAPGVTRDNARFVVHMTDPDFSSFETVFRLTETPIFQSTWSSSMIQMSNNYTYWGKNYGLVFEIPQANYSEAFWGNSHSDGEKGLEAFQNYLFGTRKIKRDDINGKSVSWDVRHYVKDHFVEEMMKMGYNLTEEEYAHLSQYLFGKKYISQIRKDIQVGQKVISAKDLKSALEKSRDKLFYGNEHNEIIPINPKVKGVFVKAKKLEDCPKEVLKFAKVHDLPIILMKPADKKSAK